MGEFTGPLWDDAERAGRIPSGRGRLYTRRVFPTRVPVTRKQLLADGVPRRTIAGEYVEVVRGVRLRPLGEDELEHPRLGPEGFGDDRGCHTHCIITRMRALALLHADAVVGYWGAAAGHGLPRWADSSPVVLLSGHSRQGTMDEERVGAVPSTRPVLRPLPPGTTWIHPDRQCPQLRVVDAATAAVQCPTTILTGKKTWDVPHVDGLPPRYVHAVQFIDAFLQCTWLTCDAITRAAKGKVDAAVLRDILTLADVGYGAESPRETILRLIVRDELPTGFTWSSQVEVDVGTNRRRKKGMTRPDLACPELKVALYYDGAHHGGAATTDTDFRLFQKLKDLGWEVVRVNRDGLREREETMETIRNAIARAVAAQLRDQPGK
ncbi:MAG: endonuclease domain-containing protein [Mycobacteriaceae bacterium]|uniref:endonuclease domain-containing protein n=1 Tax=Corynebacterium sp. TaxID=1720 RepID=UPI003F9ABB0D